MHRDGERDRAGSADYNEASTPRLHERIHKASQDQDKQIDQIYDGVVRLKGAAIATNEEVQAQTQMIGDIALQIDGTQQSVQQQTAVARRVTKSHRALVGYYVVIALEIAALIVILVI